MRLVFAGAVATAAALAALVLMVGVTLGVTPRTVQSAANRSPRVVRSNMVPGTRLDSGARADQCAAELRQIPGRQDLIKHARLRNPRKRLTTPDDVARCTTALCHPATCWMTGNALHVDGGENIVG
jgi:NAD(P)-dependent dehydrogenase (short-subunit alcohol dehydrogenase family)